MEIDIVSFYVLLRYSHVCLLNACNCVGEEVRVGEHETLLHCRCAVAVSRANMPCMDLNAVAIPLLARVRHLHGRGAILRFTSFQYRWRLRLMPKAVTACLSRHQSLQWRLQLAWSLPSRLVKLWRRQMLRRGSWSSRWQL